MGVKRYMFSVLAICALAGIVNIPRDVLRRILGRAYGRQLAISGASR